jgi:hypothetical protein
MFPSLINDSKDNNFGCNALTGDYEDLVKAGVPDPTKVVRTALTNALRRLRDMAAGWGYVLKLSCHPERVCCAKDFLLTVRWKGLARESGALFCVVVSSQRRQLKCGALEFTTRLSRFKRLWYQSLN